MDILSWSHSSGVQKGLLYHGREILKTCRAEGEESNVIT